MDIFKANVQYDDFKGSSAADASDIQEPLAWLRANGHISDGEYIFGIKMFYLGDDNVSVTFLTKELEFTHDAMNKTIHNETPLILREIRVDMALLDFFSLFKRFSVTFSSSGILENKSYIGEE